MKLNIDKYGKVSVTIEENPWSNSKHYDKLTIVEAGEGTYNTYISRVPVPAGTPLSDRHYWIPFSKLDNNIIINYNEFKASVKEEINSIKEYLSIFYKRIEDILKNIPSNRGFYEEGKKYYAGNLVQYQGSTFIAYPVDYDSGTNPLAYIDYPPYNETISNLNPGWSIFARGGANSEDIVDVVNDVIWDHNNKKFIKVFNGETSDIVTGEALKEEIGIRTEYDSLTETFTIN